MQIQITVLVDRAEQEENIVSRSRIVKQVEVVQLPQFNREVKKVVGFVIIYKLYIRIRIKNEKVEK